MPNYFCEICQKESSQKKHHQSHIETEIHQTKKEVEKLKLESMDLEYKMEKYSTDNLETILDKLENSVKKKVIKKNDSKKHKTNTPIYEKSTNDITDTENNESFKYKFLDFLGKMHNLLRGAGVTGDQALDDILNCLFLCYLEDKISDKGEFDLENSDKSCYNGTVQRKIKDYVKYLRVSYLLEHKEELRVKDQLKSCLKKMKILSIVQIQ